MGNRTNEERYADQRRIGVHGHYGRYLRRYAPDRLLGHPPPSGWVVSPGVLAILRRIERETRCLAAMHADDGTGARYPRDYYRPYELLRRWGGVAGSRFYPSVDGLGPGGP